MSRQYASQLLFELSPSGTYKRIVFICAIFSVISIFLINYHISIRLVLFAVLVYLIFSSLKNNKFRTMQWKPDGSWLISCTENMQRKQFTASLQPGSVVTSFFSILKFKLENKKILNVLIFKDNIGAEKFRQLRVRLKVEGIGTVKSK